MKYKVIFTYDNDEIVETRYEGDDRIQAELTYHEEKLNLLSLGGDDCCDVKLIVEDNRINMIKNGKNYRQLVTKITGKDWTGDRFDRILIHNHVEELDEYVEHLYCCDYKKVIVLDTREQELVTIDTPYDEEVNRTRKLMYEYFLDRIGDIDGEYLCEHLGITQDTLKDHLDYLLGEVGSN